MLPAGRHGRRSTKQGLGRLSTPHVHRGRAFGPPSLVAMALLLAAACRTPAEANWARACTPPTCQAVAGLDASGACTYRPLADGVACSDGNPCTAFDTCVGGACRGGSVLPDGTACDDGNACTTLDACSHGQCIGPESVTCGAPSTCAGKAACDPILGCVADNIGPCEDSLTAIPLVGCPLWAYAAPVRIGGTAFSLLVDSGSSTTAVAATGCSNCGNLSPTYADTATSSYQHEQVSASYADGSGWQAALYRDNVQAGSSGQTGCGSAIPLRFASVTAQANGFFSGLACSGTANVNGYQGIWGLGPAAGARPDTDAFMTALAASQSTANDAFSIELCNMGGRMWLGGYSPAASTGPVNFTPMLHGAAGNDNYYTIAIADLLVGQASLGVDSFAYGPAVVDTGTGGLALPQAAYAALRVSLMTNPNVAAALPGGVFDGDGPADRYAYAGLHGETPADLDAALPWLGLSLPRGGASSPFTLALPPSKSYLAVNAGAPGSNTPFAYTFTAYASPLTILGASLWRQHVVTFDRGGDRIGFAAQAGAWCGPALPTVQ